MANCAVHGLGCACSPRPMPMWGPEIEARGKTPASSSSNMMEGLGKKPGGEGLG